MCVAPRAPVHVSTRVEFVARLLRLRNVKNVRNATAKLCEMA